MAGAATSIIVAATKVLSRETRVCRVKIVCRDKHVFKIFCQNFCDDKHTFVETKKKDKKDKKKRKKEEEILVSAPASERTKCIPSAVNLPL